MSEPWYEVVPATAPLTQGDLIFRCPILNWDQGKPPAVTGTGDVEALQQLIVPFRADVIVLTQACDLEHGKVRSVVLCPHIAIAEYRRLWDETMRQLGHNPTEKAWRRLCDDIASGYVWNQTILNRHEGDVTMDLRIAEFNELYTLPRVFLESLLVQRGEPRLRLRPPYREHLSQGFARFFMRVGLPTPVSSLPPLPEHREMGLLLYVVIQKTASALLFGLLPHHVPTLSSFNPSQD